MRGRNVQHLVAVDTGTEQEKFGFMMIVQVVTPLQIAQAVIWVKNMIMLAIQFAITGHFIVEGVIAQQDGMERVAATVCMKFSFYINEVPQVNKLFYSIETQLFIYTF